MRKKKEEKTIVAQNLRLPYETWKLLNDMHTAQRRPMRTIIIELIEKQRKKYE